MTYFKTKELVVIALLVALLFSFDFAIGGIFAAFAGPGGEGIITGLSFGFLVVLTSQIIRKFGVLSLAGALYGLIAVPTLILGPPGIYKILLGLLVGLQFDIALKVGKFKKMTYYINFIISGIWTAGLMYFFMIFLGLPGIESFLQFVLIISAIFIMENCVAAFIAFRVWNKIKNKAFVKSLQS